MLTVRDYSCSKCDTVTEHFVTDIAANLYCECGSVLKMLLSSPPFILDGASGDFPGRHSRWIKEHEAGGKQEPLDG